jgi:hypothetical protein
MKKPIGLSVAAGVLISLIFIGASALRRGSRDVSADVDLLIAGGAVVESLRSGGQ